MPNSDTPLGGDITIADRFLFEVDGVEIGIFRQVTGLQVTVNVVEISEGGQNSFTHKLPSRMSWPNIVFKRGLTQTRCSTGCRSPRARASRATPTS
jgi:phage tail-like protein